MLHLLDTGFGHTILLNEGRGGEVFPTKAHVVKGRIVIGKYPKRAHQLAESIADDLGIVFMMRDPRDVLISTHYLKPDQFWVEPARWIAVAQAAIEHADQIHLVKFEELIREPDVVQNRLADCFGMHMLCNFSECHTHFDSTDTKNLRAMKGARPLDPTRIDNWRDGGAKQAYIESLLQENVQLREYQARFGYH